MMLPSAPHYLVLRTKYGVLRTEYSCKIAENPRKDLSKVPVQSFNWTYLQSKYRQGGNMSAKAAPEC